MGTARAMTAMRLAGIVLLAPAACAGFALYFAAVLPVRSVARRTGLTMLLLALPTAVFGALFGALLGPAACFLWAVYGPGAPERPWASGPASETRRDCSADDLADQARGVTFEQASIGGRFGLPSIHCTTARRATGGLSMGLRRNVRPRGIVVALHGLHSHGASKNALDMAAHLVMQGMVVYLPDHRGHGRSQGAWGCITSFEALAADAVHVCEVAASREGPDLPIFIQGGSLGGLVALLATARLAEQAAGRGGVGTGVPAPSGVRLAGTIAVCPALGVGRRAGNAVLEEVYAWFPTRLMKWLSVRVIPRMPVTRGTRGINYSEDKILKAKAIRENEADPLEFKEKVRFSTATTFKETLMDPAARNALLDRILGSLAGANVLVLHGTADKCVDVESSRDFIKRLRARASAGGAGAAGTAVQGMIEYPGKAHVIMSEDAGTRRRYLDDMSEFMRNIAKETAPKEMAPSSSSHLIDK